MTEGFTGTGVALVTPFQNDGSVDYLALDKVVNHVISGGVDYIVVLGTTGETATLSFSEKQQVVASVIKTVNKRVPVVIGIGGNYTAETVEKINRTDLEGISAILSVSPYYNKPTQQGLYAHYAAIAKATALPVIMYNVPGRTASNINAETALRLANDFRNIVAVKEAGGNFSQIMQLLRDKPAHFEVISGDDALTLPMIHLGAIGVISVIANSHPRAFSTIVNDALAHNFEKANANHFKLLDYINLLFEEGSPSGVKAALEIMGVCGKMVRLPLVPATGQLTKKIETELKHIG